MYCTQTKCYMLPHLKYTTARRHKACTHMHMVCTHGTHNITAHVVHGYCILHSSPPSNSVRPSKCYVPTHTYIDFLPPPPPTAPPQNAHTTAHPSHCLPLAPAAAWPPPPSLTHDVMITRSQPYVLQPWCNSSDLPITLSTSGTRCSATPAAPQ